MEDRIPTVVQVQSDDSLASCVLTLEPKLFSEKCKGDDDAKNDDDEEKPEKIVCDFAISTLFATSSL